MEVIAVYRQIKKIINSVLREGRKHENTTQLQTTNQ